MLNSGGDVLDSGVTSILFPGKHVILSDSNSKAEKRSRGFGLLFTSRPLQPGERLVLTVVGRGEDERFI